MTFEEVLDQAIAMLQRRGRLTYRTLQLQFQLDEAHLEALKDELIYGQRLAMAVRACYAALAIQAAVKQYAAEQRALALATTSNAFDVQVIAQICLGMMLGTMAPLTEEILSFPFGGIAPGDDAYGLAFAIPTDAPGLKFICRETVSPPLANRFDHPLSSRFEEMDCVVIFDDVLVPWDRVIVDGGPGSATVLNQVGGNMAAMVNVQTAARMLSQMEFFCGLAMKLADAIGITGFLHVQEKLGEMLSILEVARGVFYGTEALAREGPDGIWTINSPAGLPPPDYAHLPALRRNRPPPGRRRFFLRRLAGGPGEPRGAALYRQVPARAARDLGRGTRPPLQAGLGRHGLHFRPARDPVRHVLLRGPRAPHCWLLPWLRQGAAVRDRRPGAGRTS